MRKRLTRLSIPALKISTTAMLFLFGLTACGSAATDSRKSSSEPGGAQQQASSDKAAPQATPMPVTQTNFTSVYTDMKRDCKALPDPEREAQGSDPLVECKGYGGYKISMGYSAAAAHVAVENAKKPDESISLGTDYLGYGDKGEMVEWRVANDKPFAVIIRLGKYKEVDDPVAQYTDKNRIGSTLVIKGLKGWEQIDFKVDGATPKANEKARELADQNYAPK